jgi:hypothetical protein
MLSKRVAAILDAEQITPAMIYDLLLSGNQIYRQGVGSPHSAVWDAVLKPFGERQRHYLNPYQVATLRDHEYPQDTDFEHLEV